LSTLYFETVQGQNSLHGFVNHHLQLYFLQEK
jgi:hypothetical protein